MKTLEQPFTRARIVQTTAKHGFEHRLFFTILSDSLRFGPAQVSHTARRNKWLADHPDWPPSVYLICSFAYAEGKLGRDFVENHGGFTKRELCVLRIARNALVHCDGALTGLKKQQHTPLGMLDPKSDPLAVSRYVARLAADLSAGRVTDQKGRPVAPYLKVIREKQIRRVRLENPASFLRISSLMTQVFIRSGHLSK